MKKRWLAILMAMMMAISLLPTAAWAEEPVDSAGSEPSSEGTTIEVSGETTLEAAISGANAGDTVKLTEDISLTSSITIDKALTLDLNGKTITVGIQPAAEATTQDAATTSATISAFVVTETGDFTVKNGKIIGTASLDNRAIEGQAGSSITVNGVSMGDFNAKTGNGGTITLESGSLVIENGSSLGYWDPDARVGHGNKARNGGAVYANNSVVTIRNSKLYYNSSEDPTGTPDQSWFGGGSLFLEGSQTNVTIEGNDFFRNSTKDFGAAIHLDAVGKAIIGSNNRIRSGDVSTHQITTPTGQGRRGGEGGAIYSRISSHVEITNNTIINNMATTAGGGIAIYSSAGNYNLIQANTIKNNSASTYGGGLYLKLDKKAIIEIPSGLFEENSAIRFGGAIAYTGHNMPTLKLENALITGNTAPRGAGIWACPTSETTSYSTLGGAIYGNTASGKTLGVTSADKLDASGDDIRYEGKDTPDKFSLTLNDPSPTTIMTVSKRALGGGLMKWYQDEADARYSTAEAPEEANASLYTNTNKSFGLHGELSQDSQARAERHAKLIIKNNFCNGRGGGIATNSPIQIGLAGHDLDVVVEKKWTKEEHPDSATVTLVQVDKDKVAVELETVTLNAENNWTHTFRDLPGCYTDSNGELQDYTYTVKEAAIDGWVYSVKDVTDTHQQANDTTTPGTTTDTESTTESDSSDDQAPAETPSTGKNPNKVIYLELTNSPKPSGGGGGGGNNRPTLNTEDHFGYIIGYPVDYFTGEPTTDQTKKPVRPQGEITRAEVATIFFRMLTDESRAQYWSQESGYSDVAQGQWFNAAVSTLSKAGIISGYPDGSFRPNGSITRAEFATIAVRFFDVQYDGAHLFPDIDGHWAQDYIDQAGSAGLVNGYPDGTFGPDRSITRAEAVTLVNRTLDRHPDPAHFLKDMLVWPDNMDTTAWYYADMQEATNSHQYEMKTDSDKTKYEVWTKMLPIRDWEAFEKAWSDAGSASNPGEVVNK